MSRISHSFFLFLGVRTGVSSSIRFDRFLNIQSAEPGTRFYTRIDLYVLANILSAVKIKFTGE